MVTCDEVTVRPPVLPAGEEEDLAVTVLVDRVYPANNLVRSGL